MALTAATIPVIVGDAILESLKANLVYGKLFNQDYIGNVAPGNSVKIPSIGSVLTEAYVQGTDLEGQDAEDSSVSLLINKQRAFEVRLDDVDAIMAKPAVLAAYAKEAAYQLQLDIDADLAAELAGAGTLVANFGTSTTPIEVNSANICSQLRAMALAMDNAKVPRGNRFIVLPPWAIEKLTLASIVDATDNSVAMADGIVARYAGFNITMSPVVPNTTGAKYSILAAAPISATYAVAINKTEVIRHPKQFADILRGLVVYGAKATRPATIVNGYWNLAAEA